MRHLKSGFKLSRDIQHRESLRRNLAAALFINGRIRTTKTRAKFVKPFVEKILTIAGKGTLAARRRVIAMLQDRFVVDQEETDIKRDKSFDVVSGPKLIHKVFSEVAPKYVDRPGGYTRIIPLGERRLGDNGEVVYLELIDPETQKQSKRSKTGGNRRRKARDRNEFYNKLMKGGKETTAQTEAPAQEQAAEEPAEEKAKEQTQQQTSTEETEKSEDDKKE